MAFKVLVSNNVCLGLSEKKKKKERRKRKGRIGKSEGGEEMWTKKNR
jgi:hypothetical protein